MSDQRQKIGPRINRETWQQFREFVHDVHGETRGRVAQELENAIEEYMDRDRTARLEDDHAEILERLNAVEASLTGDPGTRTHTGHAKPRTVSEKVELIGAGLREHDHPVMTEERVEQAIKDVAGADDRTLTKYKDELRKNDHAFRHPASSSSAWTTDPSQFATWVLAHMSNVPDAHITDVLEPYGMDATEYEQHLDDAEREERQQRVNA